MSRRDNLFWQMKHALKQSPKAFARATDEWKNYEGARTAVIALVFWIVTLGTAFTTYLMVR